MISTQKTRASIKKAWAALFSQLCCAKISGVSEYSRVLHSVPLINIVEAPIRWRNQTETSSRRVKAFHFRFGMSNTSLKVRCKSLHFGSGVPNTNLKVRCKSLHFRSGVPNTNLKVRCKSLHFGSGVPNTSLKVRCKRCLA